MQALVSISFRSINVIDDSAGLFVEHTGQARVYFQGHVFLLLHILTGENNLHDMTERDVIEIVARPFHLAPDAIRGTVRSTNHCVNALFSQHFANLIHEASESALMAQSVSLNESGNLLILMGATITETQVLQFNLCVIQPKTIGKRRIEEVRLSGNLHLLVRRHASQRPHVVKTVGKLNQQGTDVIFDGVEHLPVVVHLL